VARCPRTLCRAHLLPSVLLPGPTKPREALPHCTLSPNLATVAAAFPCLLLIKKYLMQQPQDLRRPIIAVMTVRQDEFEAMLARFPERRVLNARQLYEVAGLPVPTATPPP
jgi:hypothetical protein